MESFTIQQPAKRIRLLNAVAAVLAFPAALGFAWLCAEGRHTGLLGFFFVWLVGAGVILRVYAQFLRLWHGVGYHGVATPRPKTPIAEAATLLAGPSFTAKGTTLLAVPTEPLRTRTAEAATPLALPVFNEPRPERAGAADTKEEKTWRDELQKAWAEAEIRAARMRAA